LRRVVLNKSSKSLENSGTYIDKKNEKGDFILLDLKV
jgi:hypothetical protein